MPLHATHAWSLNTVFLLFYFFNRFSFLYFTYDGRTVLLVAGESLKNVLLQLACRRLSPVPICTSFLQLFTWRAATDGARSATRVSQDYCRRWIPWQQQQHERRNNNNAKARYLRRNRSIIIINIQHEEMISMCAVRVLVWRRICSANEHELWPQSQRATTDHFNFIESQRIPMRCSKVETRR